MKYFSMILTLLLTGTGLAGEFQITRNLTLPASSVDLLDIDCGSGFLKIEGEKNSNEISVQADIYIDARDEDSFNEILDKALLLELDKFGHKAELKSGFDHSSSFLERLFDGGFDSRIDLTIRAPYRLALKIDDGSGFVSIKNMGDKIELDDGSGNVDISDVEGKVSLDDGSGEVTLTHCGAIWLDDGSGQIYISQISGSVWVDDGAGDMTIREVGGDVEIDDGSGDIDIEEVAGDVIIKEGGSGGLHTRNISGRLINEDD